MFRGSGASYCATGQIVVKLDALDVATGVAYYQHFCDPFVDSDYGVYSWSAMEVLGFLQDTHPIVYSAIGGHPSYPTNVGNELLPCGVGTDGAGDQTSENGVVWQTWESELKLAATTPISAPR